MAKRLCVSMHAVFLTLLVVPLLLLNLALVGMEEAKERASRAMVS
ncbi:MAG TPA: hypothetical protein VKF36_11645 [Syntrophorhabdales bacterium]|nr:hypothetical protein [Syntrophorhabdales bacterium]